MAKDYKVGEYYHYADDYDGSCNYYFKVVKLLSNCQAYSEANPHVVRGFNNPMSGFLYVIIKDILGTHVPKEYNKSLYNIASNCSNVADKSIHIPDYEIRLEIRDVIEGD